MDTVRSTIIERLMETPSLEVCVKTRQTFAIQMQGPCQIEDIYVAPRFASIPVETLPAFLERLLDGLGPFRSWGAGDGKTFPFTIVAQFDPIIGTASEVIELSITDPYFKQLLGGLRMRREPPKILRVICNIRAYTDAAQLQKALTLSPPP